MRKLVLAVMVILAANLVSPLTVTPSLAEPNATTRYLMDDPISMLDWGIFRTEVFLSRWLPKRYPDLTAWPHVSYRWPGNRIVVTVNVFRDDLAGTGQVQAWLTGLISELKGTFGIPSEEALSAAGPSRPSRVAAYFMHPAFKRKGQPPDLAAGIDRLIDLEIVLYRKVTREGYSDAVTARTALLRPEIQFAWD